MAATHRFGMLGFWWLHADLESRFFEGSAALFLGSPGKGSPFSYNTKGKGVLPAYLVFLGSVPRTVGHPVFLQG